MNKICFQLGIYILYYPYFEMYIVKRNRWCSEISTNMEDEANISISPTTHSFNKEFLSTYYVPDTIEQSAPV